MKLKFLAVPLFIAGSFGLYSFDSKPVEQAPKQQGDPLAKSIAAGKTLYTTYCQVCHQENGMGIEGAFPPLAKSDYLMADTKRAIGIVKNGLQGEVTVNGKKYNNVMPPQPLTDEQVAQVLNYVRNSWGNKGKIVTTAEAKAVAKK
jgi:mono/diheme cytochrome c family protein